MSCLGVVYYRDQFLSQFYGSCLTFEFMVKFLGILYGSRLGSSSFDRFAGLCYWSTFKFTFTIEFTSRLDRLCSQIQFRVMLIG